MNAQLKIKMARLGGMAAIVVSVLAACTSTTVDEFRQAETGIESHESVVILGRRQASDYETRSEFVDGVGDHLGRGAHSSSVVPEQAFVDALSPLF